MGYGLRSRGAVAPEMATPEFFRHAESLLKQVLLRSKGPVSKKSTPDFFRDADAALDKLYKRKSRGGKKKAASPKPDDDERREYWAQYQNPQYGILDKLLERLKMADYVQGSDLLQEDHDSPIRFPKQKTPSPWPEYGSLSRFRSPHTPYGELNGPASLKNKIRGFLQPVPTTRKPASPINPQTIAQKAAAKANQNRAFYEEIAPYVDQRVDERKRDASDAIRLARENFNKDLIALGLPPLVFED